MPKRNEIYGWEIAEAAKLRKEQKRMNIAKTIIGWLSIIGLGFLLGLGIKYVMGF